ncbi:MerR family transcriptional regulator [Sediminibacillus dalangtanensis]|uniref:MerR family transcriptional regulator n=1 Tax=Sediminibacillus dalangtanensis TaxID=2729421 RepID=A0ABX7VZA2_9BACI|nr:MerR family transcriptional regulator [Sediminibacillus dalangtanensis]QTN01091.1 MerR family transcriptional regulator [Sediminibacillus dalangtanensis]
MMRIGEFVKEMKTTKDTVRHYEDLELLEPAWNNGQRLYGLQQKRDFEAIREMKSLGLSLKDIQAIVRLRRMNGCGSEHLIKGVSETLMVMQERLGEEEQAIRNKKRMVKELLGALRKSELERKPSTSG